ncbi:GNAT family N-acetyltransferase [Uliginosibacterium sp. H1]|uniref:GNAT family N-acetyltransferase n=1 Tax=Uliginosibacterium sp. H1 TaxID=3114757 RepID=UPI002E19D5CF|nr:GNAT family N-acetyltransferase [Uliginosibacterium sp. H1]
MGEKVVTDATYRRQGHGGAVLREAIERVRAANCYKRMLLTGRKDAATLGFYRGLGFDAEAKQGMIIDLRAGPGSLQAKQTVG